ncbi:hypothetical protein JVU11DRAFT_9324 [Chiua virens]|nr:hypothetical protein JVU11DRAFT_9324 [Chiua virens]
MHKRARNIAKDPYAAAKYFFFIIDTVFSTLFGIHADRFPVKSRMGALGHISAYFGVVEAQGRGTLHLHTFVWLENTPNVYELRELLRTPDFQDKIQRFIRENIRAHIDSLDEDTIRSTPHDTQIGYSRVPDPDGFNWESEMCDLEKRVVRASQIHSCSISSSLRYDNHGRLSCKRRAPWPTSVEDVVDDAGNWSPKRTYGFMNNFCPAISTSLFCNNDIKLLTNGRDTKDVMWYTTLYATKKQSKNNNISALMAKALMYHESHSAHLSDALERNRLLLFRCQQPINREMVLSGPQVVAYILSYGDSFHSHHYVPLYWSVVQRHLEAAFADLQPETHEA